MKKVLLFAAVSMFSLGASAQFDQGNIIVGGGSDLGFSSGTTTSEFDGEELEGEVKSTSFGFTPYVGFFAADGLVVGLMLDFESDKVKLVPDEGDELENTSSAFGVGPFVRYYIGDSGLFGEGHVSFGNMKYTDQYIDFLTGDIEEDESEASFFGWGVGVGFAMMLNDHIAVEPMLSFGGVTETMDYDTGEETVEGKDSTTGISFSVALTGILDN